VGSRLGGEHAFCSEAHICNEAEKTGAPLKNERGGRVGVACYKQATTSVVVKDALVLFLN
jgi:hypothetical protein